MSKLVDEHDSKSCGLTAMWVRVPPRAPIHMLQDKENLSYIIGVALGDGNLSNPNGRATRLRITCDTKYKNILNRICLAIQNLLPRNKVSIIKRAKTFCDISCYSNKWEKWLGWTAKGGPKYKQNIAVPNWIIKNRKYSIACLRGLLETDGSIYDDRGYKMVNFVTIIPGLAENVVNIIKKLGFRANIYKIKSKNSAKYTIRLSKNVGRFIQTIDFSKN